MMNATFKLDGCTTLRIGTDLMLPDQYAPRGYVALLLEREPMMGPMGPSANDAMPTAPVPPTEITTLAVLPPSQARAMASVLLSAATEARP